MSDNGEKMFTKYKKKNQINGTKYFKSWLDCILSWTLERDFLILYVIVLRNMNKC